MPSSQPGKKTTSNSNPLAAWRVMSVTSPSLAAFSPSMTREICSRKPSRFSKFSIAPISSLRFSRRPSASGVFSFCHISVYPLSSRTRIANSVCAVWPASCRQPMNILTIEESERLAAGFNSSVVISFSAAASIGRPSTRAS